MKRFLCLLPVVLAACTLQAAPGTDEQPGSSLNDQPAAEITSIGSGWFEIPVVDTNVTGRVVFPQTIGGVTVTNLDDFAFYGCEVMTDISLPATATGRYGISAFSNCKGLRSVRLPDGMTELGTSIFSGCENLQSVDLPSSLRKVTQFAFFRCPSLTSINLPPSITNILDAAFASCSSLQSIELPKNLERLGASTFADCTNLSSVVFHDKVGQLGTRAFYNCINLKNVTFKGPVPALIDTAPGQKTTWPEVFENVPVESLTITYPAAHASDWKVVIAQIGCKGQMEGAAGRPAVIPEDQALRLSVSEEEKIIQAVTEALGTVSGPITVRGTTENVRAAFALGILPRVDAGAVAVFERPSLLVTAFDLATQTIAVRAVPGQGGRLDSDARIKPGVLKAYGAKDLASIATATGQKVDVESETANRAGEATLTLRPGAIGQGRSSFFLRVAVEP